MAAEHRERPTIPPASELAALPRDGGPQWNRLVFESSPYLLQHAANPVDWYPWGEAAFEKAREEDKPVFLSIGYATCHWCHVMERESFEQAAVAAAIQQTCVAIKVDKEERPDIDDLYMAACMAMNGHGGWPLTVFLDHERRPFFAGTYFPPHSQGNRIGLTDLLARVHELWTDRRADLLKEAENLTDHIRQMRAVSPGTELSQKELAQAYHQLETGFDDVHGGFGSAPKFPSPHQFLFLLRHGRTQGVTKAHAMVTQTLTAMRQGGLFDQIGFGFHRYSTDAEWLVPHFEKMLYDQALLAYAYLETYAATKQAGFAETARQMFTYVLRDMTSPEGAFFSAEDADSEGEEGTFYLWNPDQVAAVLGTDEAEWFNGVFDITEAGNYREEATGMATGQSIPRLTQSLALVAEKLDIPLDRISERVDTARRALFEARGQRIAPFKDDKVLTDWNGLMIAAFALGGRPLREPLYVTVATRACRFIWANLRNEQGRLWKRYRQGQAGLPALLDDYAFLCWGVLECYRTTLDADFLAMALTLEEQVSTHFWGDDEGAYFSTADDGEALLVRGMTIQDGALPSGNSVMAWNLIRLARLTGRPEFEARAQRIFTAFSMQIKRYPSMSPMLLCALDMHLNAGREIVIVGKPEAAETEAMLAVVAEVVDADTAVVLRSPEDKRMDRLAPFTSEFPAEGGGATAYVCHNRVCHTPTSCPRELRQILAATPS